MREAKVKIVLLGKLAPMMTIPSAFNAVPNRNQAKAMLNRQAGNHPSVRFQGQPQTQDTYTAGMSKAYPFKTVLDLREAGNDELAKELVTDMKKNDPHGVGFLTLDQWGKWNERLAELGIIPARTSGDYMDRMPKPEIQVKVEDEKDTALAQASASETALTSPVKRDFSTALDPQSATKTAALKKLRPETSSSGADVAPEEKPKRKLDNAFKEEGAPTTRKSKRTKAANTTTTA